ncbi:hypothetical protein [Cupriavidus campinensis]
MIKSISFLEATISHYDGKKGEAAKALGVGPAAISTWLKRKHVSPAGAARCAAIVGEDPAFAEAIAGAETIEDDSARATVLKMLHKAFNRSFRKLLSAPKTGVRMAS